MAYNQRDVPVQGQWSKRERKGMIRRALTATVVVALAGTAALAAEGKTYGKGITLQQETKISDILANPDAFVGKKVLVSGTIVDVCAHKGCWIEIAGEKAGEKIRVKVKEGEIVFPMTAKGRKVLAEGVVEKVVKPHGKSTKGHASGCTGEKGHEGKKCSGDCTHGAGTVYLIKGTGAVIE